MAAQKLQCKEFPVAILKKLTPLVQIGQQCKNAAHVFAYLFDFFANFHAVGSHFIRKNTRKTMKNNAEDY